MSFTRKYIPRLNFVLTEMKNGADNKQFEEHVKLLTEETAHLHPILQLADITQLTDISGLTENGVALAASKEMNRFPYNIDKLAILVSNKEVEILAHVYKLVSSYFRNDVKIFSDFITAINWLGLDKHADEINKLRMESDKNNPN